MSHRLKYLEQSPEIYKSFFGFATALAKDTVIEESIRNLIDIRVSQLNGCAFCLDMHVKQAKMRGERELRVHHISIWRESPIFSDRERAAFAWAELLTRIGVEGVSDADYAAALEQFSEKELSDLTFSVMTINAWNRLNVAFRYEPGSRDKAFGLDKTGLN